MNNYWGTTNTSEIDQKIYDFYDDFTAGKVIYEPILTVPNNNAPIPPPMGLTADAGDTTIDLSWEVGTVTDLAGYRIYYDTDASGMPYDGTGVNEGSSPIDVGDVTNYQLSGLSAGITYYITATAYDSSGDESWYSDEVTVVVGGITTTSTTTSTSTTSTTSTSTTMSTTTSTTTTSTSTSTTSISTTSTTLIPLYCTDYDNGIKTENSSWVEFTEDGILVETEYDSCADNRTVLEWYCFGTMAQSIEITCGDSCSGGMCVSGTTTTSTSSTSTISTTTSTSSSTTSTTTSTTSTTTSTTSTTSTLPLYTATANRTLPETAPAGSSVNVNISLDVNETTKPNSIIIKDYFPAGWNVTGSEPAANSVNSTEGEIKWILTGDEVFDRTLHYVVEIPTTELGNGTFSGELLYNDPEGSPVTLELA